MPQLDASAAAEMDAADHATSLGALAPDDASGSSKSRDLKIHLTWDEVSPILLLMSPCLVPLQVLEDTA